MNAKHLILTILLTLGAGVAVAAIKYGHSEAAKAPQAAETSATAVPRIVIIGRR